MSDLVEEESERSRRRIETRVSGAITAMRIDMARLHGAWMGLCFSRGLEAEYSIVEEAKPESPGGVIAYRLWALIGLPVSVVAYPLFVLGLATRYYARRLDRLTASVGVVGVVLASLAIWGLLTAATYVSPIAFEGLIAVAIAGLVATGSAVLGMYFTARGGRGLTVGLGYPFGVTAIFLPPVVASLYSPTLAAFVFPGSESIAIWLLDNLLAVGGLAGFIRATFELEGLAYVGMWFGLAVPTGWGLGGLVSLATVIRDGSITEGVDGDGLETR